MRDRIRLLVALSIALAVGAFSAALVAAATAAELQQAAEDHGMTCSPQATSVACSRVATNFAWTAVIAPESGEVEQLDTTSGVPSPPLDAESTKWLKAMHGLACGKQAEIDAFIDQLAAMTKDGSIGPTDIGVCTIGGSVNVADLSAASQYDVRSQIAPPPSTPSPGPTRTPRPTPGPTPTPAAPTATPAPTAAASSGPSPSATASIAPSAIASAAATAAPFGPSPTPDGGGQPTDMPTVTQSPGGGGGATAAPTFPTFAQSVAGITDINPDGGALGGSLLLALLLLLLIAFVAELFNNTVENNYDEIAGWFRKGPFGSVRRWIDRVRIDPPGRPGVLLFIALTALISSFVDPRFGLDLRSVAVFLGFLVGLIVVLASFKLPPILARRRRTGELGQLRPLPWALVIAVLFVLVSRLGNLQPGYLYGIVLGAFFMSDVSKRDEGRDTFYGSLWTLAAAALAWIGLTWLRAQGLPEDGFGVTLLSTAFGATLVAGLEAAAFGLMPLRFMPGHAVYRWNRLGWALLWGLSLFAFVHVLIGPSSGYVSELSPAAFLAALGVFAAFGALSIGTWLYFRFRPRPEPA